MQQQTKRAAIYARTATVQELTPSFAMDEQVRQCKEYCVQKGYQLVDGQIYQETTSGNSTVRPLLEALYEAGREGKIDTLLICDYSRLARKVNVLLSLIALFEEVGIVVESVTEPLSDTDLSLFLKHTHAFVAQMERQQITKRMQSGRKRRSDTAPHGSGIDPAPSVYTVNPQEAEHVQHLFSHFAQQ